MIVCGKCGGKSSVTDSRPVHSTIRRRRVCRTCKFRWTTFEMGADATQSIRNAARQLENLVAASRRMAEMVADFDELDAITVPPEPRGRARKVRPDA